MSNKKKLVLSGTPFEKVKASGHVYYVQRFFDKDGTRRDKTGSTPEKALEAACAVLGISVPVTASAASKSTLIEPVAMGKPISGDCTFDDLWERYMYDAKHGLHGKKPMSETTIPAQWSKYRTWYKPKLGALRVKDITNSHIRAYIAFLLDSTSNANAITLRRPLMAALNYGVRLEVIAECPGKKEVITAQYSKVAKRKKMRIPSEEQMRDLELMARDCYYSTDFNVGRAYKRYYPMFLILRATGVRISECLGLKWEDFNEDFSYVQIERRICAPRNQLEEGDRVGDLKSKNGIRKLPVSADIRDVLRKYRETCDTDWVFATKSGNPLNYSNVQSKFWLPLCERAQIKGHGMHMMRHYFASKMIDEKEYSRLQEFLGHHSVAYTMQQYGHVLDDAGVRDQVIADKIMGGMFV